MSRDTPALFRRFPHAAGRIPWVRLGELPTPVQGFAAVAPRAAPATVSIKRDDLSSRLYGGNKVRALEFLLGHAISCGAERVLTAGAVGSHHVSATARFARELGLSVEAFLWERPSAPRGSEAPGVLERLGVPNRRLAGPVWALAALVWRWWRLRAAGRRVTLIPPGGASARGALGFVDAALELAEQVAAGETEAPDSIWIACGTGASTAGLLVGLALAGLSCRVRAVRVTPRLVSNRFRLHRLASGAGRLLKQAGVYQIGVHTLTRAPLDLVHTQYARGYGMPSRAAQDAMALMEAAGIHGDCTYTGRALAALMDAAPSEGGRHLYWHTLPADHRRANGPE